MLDSRFKLWCTLMEVFVHSHSVYTDVGFVREMSHHVFCDPEMASRASEIFTSKFKGRILCQEDLAVLEQMSLIAERTREKLEINDVSGIGGMIKAAVHGVRRTPTVIFKGEKLEGKEEILRAIAKEITGQT